MSVQNCPNCHERAFAWSINDVDQTQWFCTSCAYIAIEEEAAEADCPNCNSNKTWLKLSDSDGDFQFCLNCQIKR